MCGLVRNLKNGFLRTRLNSFLIENFIESLKEKAVLSNALMKINEGRFSRDEAWMNYGI